MNSLYQVNCKLKDCPFSESDLRGALELIGAVAARTAVPRNAHVWRDINCILDPSSFKVPSIS